MKNEYCKKTLSGHHHWLTTRVKTWIPDKAGDKNTMVVKRKYPICKYCGITNDMPSL